MCGHDPKSRGLPVTRLNKEKRGSFSEDKRKIGGSFGEDYKKEGFFSEDFSLKKKRGSQS